MNWLDELEYVHEYKCKTCGHVMMIKSHGRLDPLPDCIKCEGETEYGGFQNMKLTMLTKVSYDQNGRQAYRITTGDGNVTHISKTKYEYLKNQTNKSQLTKEYINHVQDQQEDQFGKFRKELDSKATVTGPKEDIKQLEAKYFSKGDE